MTGKIYTMSPAYDMSLSQRCDAVHSEGVGWERVERNSNDRHGKRRRGLSILAMGLAAPELAVHTCICMLWS